MRGIYFKEYAEGKYFYLVKKIDGKDYYEVISKISKNCIFAKGSRLTLEQESEFHSVGSRDLFRIIFRLS